MRSVELQMIDTFQCPGCIHGTDPETCSKHKLSQDTPGSFFYCVNWRPSTFMGGVGRIALGLPRGFLRTGMVEFGDKPFCYIRLFKKPEDMLGYDKFNVPVWAMERDGHLFVRCYSPRNNWLFVDVVKDGKLEHAPGAINAGEFYEEMD
jgi:hypothetical protein